MDKIIVEYEKSYLPTLLEFNLKYKLDIENKINALYENLAHVEKIISQVSKALEGHTENSSVSLVHVVHKKQAKNKKVLYAPWLNIKVPLTYDFNATLKEKVLFVWSQVKQGNTNEVAKRLLELDPKTFINEKRAKKEASHHSSKFGLAGTLIVVKSGQGAKGNIYKFKG